MKAVFLILLASVLAYSSQANAGFLLGYAMGSSGNTVRPQQSEGVVVMPDAQSSAVISCVAIGTDCHLPLQQMTREDHNNRITKVTVQEYASRAGFSKILSRGIVVYRDAVHIILSVSR